MPKYNLFIKKTVIPKRKKINIIIDLAGYKLKVNNKINWHKNFLDPESEERLHRLSWIIDLISKKKSSKHIIEWCEYQILDWYNRFFFEINLQNKNGCKWSPYTVSERISNIYLFYNIYYSFIFLIIDIFFIFILQSIKYLKIKINNQISSESFINIFFNSSLNDNNNLNNNINKKILDIININKNNIINLENNIDWINLQQILSSEWKKYYIFGVPIDDLSILNKLFAIFIIFSIGKNLFIIFNS